MKKTIAVFISAFLIGAILGGFIGHSFTDESTNICNECGVYFDQPAVFCCDNCGVSLYETIHYCNGCASDEIGAGTFCNDCFFEIHQ